MKVLKTREIPFWGSQNAIIHRPKDNGSQFTMRYGLEKAMMQTFFVDLLQNASPGHMVSLCALNPVD